jgi:uncharacterized protein TP_0793
MATISILEQKVLREAYPHLSLTDDLDIERYFELRQAGQLGAALTVYNNTLRTKYPDDALRVQLLSFYRTKNPRFYELLMDSLAALAETTISNIKKAIVYITDKTLAVNTNDVFGLITAMESLIGQIGSDRFAVIAETEKYTRFADILGFRFEEMKRASELVRMYITDTISSVTDYRNEQARLKQKQLEREQRQSLVQTIDFSKVVFSKEQIAQIVLPCENLGIEDTVLTYIIKYWDKVFDRSFENMVLLYSRKYKTRHYDVFNSLKTARTRQWQDAELLNAVLSNVVSGYYYNISGDVYLNRSWQRIKPVLQSGNTMVWSPSQKPLLLPDNRGVVVKNPQAQPVVSQKRVLLTTAKAGQVANELPDKKSSVATAVRSIRSPIQSQKQFESKIVQSETKSHQEGVLTDKTIRYSMTAEELKAEQKKQDEKYALMKAEEADYFSHTRSNFRENARRLAESEKLFLEKQYRESRKARTSTIATEKKSPVASAKSSRTENSEKKQTQTVKPTTRQKKSASVKRLPSATVAKKPKKQTTVTQPKTNFFVPQKNSNFDPCKINSIENMIKKATGKNYVVYKDVFFKTIRTSIRHVLSVTKMHRQTLFKTEQNTAENIIYVFLERNYANLYQTWETSNAKDTVYQLGFNVKSIEQIIKHWAAEVLKNK